MKSQSEYACSLVGKDGKEHWVYGIIAKSPSAAKYKYFMDCDCYDDYYPDFANWCIVKKVGEVSIRSYLGDAKTFDRVATARGIDAFVYQGMAISVNGKSGIVVGGNSSQNLDILIGKEICNCHPLWETIYYNSDGSIAADYSKGDERNDPRATRKACYGNYLVSTLTGCGDCQQRDDCLLDSKIRSVQHEKMG